jgi:hypothetical protein
MLSSITGNAGIKSGKYTNKIKQIVLIIKLELSTAISHGE